MPNELTQEERSDLVDELKRDLDNYLAARAERFSVKDKLSSADKTAREGFINGLKKELDAFVKSGNNQEILQELKNGITQYPGLHLQTTLHQITLKLVDDTPTEDLPKSRWADGKPDLQHRDYPAAIRQLHLSVYALELFAGHLSNTDEKGAVQHLASQLCKDIDYLQSQHPDNAPSKKEFERFQTKFNARLHSQDVMMSQHKNWKSLVLNVVLAVVTLGIALGVKAIHSKVTEGRVSFFAAENEVQSKIKKVGQDLENAAQKLDSGSNTEQNKNGSR